MSQVRHSSAQPWFAVKCLFSHPGRAEAAKYLFEERTTLWQAGSFQEAFKFAESEAADYARINKCIFIRAADSFHLFGESVGHGSEIWSVMRSSGMEPELYVETFCATPNDRAGILDDNAQEE